MRRKSKYAKSKWYCTWICASEISIRTRGQESDNFVWGLGKAGEQDARIVMFLENFEDKLLEKKS